MKLVGVLAALGLVMLLGRVGGWNVPAGLGSRWLVGSAFPGRLAKDRTPTPLASWPS